MKKLILPALLLLSPVVVSAQTATVTGSLRFPSGGAPTKASVCFTLEGYKPNVPVVTGSAVVINATNFCVNADVNGDVPSGTTLYRNDFITPSGTYWNVDYKYNNLLQARAAYSVASGTFDLDSATPISTAPAAATTSVIAQGYVHTQSPAATTWTINHNFNNQRALCQFVDGSNQLIWPDTFVQTSTTVATATFTIAQAGTATCVVAGSFTLISSSLSGALLTTPTSDQAAAGNYNLAVGGNFQWDSGTVFRATFDHANSATRTYTFPDLTGTIALLSGSQTISGTKTFSVPWASSVSTGTAPFTVTSTTKVSNLNADSLDGLDSSNTATASTIGARTSGGDFDARRYKVAGTTLGAGNFAAGANWGSGASISAVGTNSKDSAFTVEVTSGSSGTGANPETTLTFANGTWTKTPTCVVQQSDTNDAFQLVNVGSITATAVTWTWRGTPNTSKTYTFVGICVGVE